jgi:hypothetical protein
MLACVIPNVSASCATRVPALASSTTCLRTPTGYLLGTASSSLNAGGFQKRDSPGQLKACKMPGRLSWVGIPYETV